MESLNAPKRGTPFRSPTTTPTLPPETWNHIFQFLDPGDLYSVARACPEWNELLQEKRNTFLLSLVIPSVMKYVDKSTTLKLRRISNSTKNAVDKTLQSFSDSDDEDPFDPCRIRYDESKSERYLRSIARSISRSYKFTSRDFGMFLNRVYPNLSVVSSKDNPFLMRYISYVSDLWAENGPHVLSILPKFGHHLSSLTCTIVGNTSNPPFHNIVVQLRLVPNIKQLCIEPAFHIRNETEMHLSRSSSTIHEFPALPKLVILEVRIIRSNVLLDTLVLGMLRHYGKQLVRFSCDAKLFVSEDLNVDRLNLMFPNIKQFHMKGFGSLLTTGLEKLSKVSWPLKRLHLDSEVRDCMTLKKMILTVSSFYQSLEHLIVTCAPAPNWLRVPNGNDPEEKLRKMSKLKTFITRVENMESDLFCKFLKNNCQNLEQLYLTNFDNQQMDRGRWALEHLNNLAKVVFCNLVISTNVDELGETHTMRRTTPNDSASGESANAERK
ncbi:unnamed protein product [Orchesella dallaii]|uniref:F-box domain-containing protein n=1 Tax=Orchesella dallaii TaxID=48710 RepID=A0ABP1QF69_9HEXA